MTKLQTISGITITDPEIPSYVIPNPIMTSDSFTAADGTVIVGRVLDCALGGSPRSWVGTASQVVITGNAMQRVSTGLATFFDGVAADSADYEVQFQTATIPTASGSPAFSICARQGSSSTTSDRYTAAVRADGSLALQKRISSTTTTLSVGSYTFAAGDWVGIRAVGTAISLTRNGVALETVTDTSLAPAGYAGIGGASTTTAFNLPAFRIRTITDAGLL